MMTQSVVTKQLSFIFSIICEETRTNPSSDRDRGGVWYGYQIPGAGIRHDCHTIGPDIAAEPT